MIDNPFRALLPRYTSSLIRIYQRLGLTPNMITVVGFILAAGAAYLIFIHWFLSAAVVWWAGRLLDGTDGIYARATNQATSFGAFLDIVFDMASYCIVLFGFNSAFPELQWSWLSMMFFYVLCITSALALGNLEEKNRLMKKDNRGLRLASGIAEGGETGIAYTLFLLLPEYIALLTKIWIGVLFITVVARTLLAKSELVENKK